MLRAKIALRITPEKIPSKAPNAPFIKNPNEAAGIIKIAQIIIL
jgi:hypothetical protein